MRDLHTWFVSLVLVVWLLPGCGSSQPTAGAVGVPQGTQATPAQPPPSTAKTPVTTPAATPAPPPPTVATQAPPPDVVYLKAAPGTVKFKHSKHAGSWKVACDTCHHPSRPEKAAAGSQQACRVCHTSVAAPPMKTKLQAAFHDPTATSGLCIDCHKLRDGPVKKCTSCHKRA